MYHLTIHKYANFEICIKKYHIKNLGLNFFVTSNIQMLIKLYK